MAAFDSRHRVAVLLIPESQPRSPESAGPAGPRQCADPCCLGPSRIPPTFSIAARAIWARLSLLSCASGRTLGGTGVLTPAALGMPFPMKLKSSVLLTALSVPAFPAGYDEPGRKPLSGSDWAGIREEYQRHRQAAFAVAGGHRARNYAQHWVTRFDGRGFEVTPDSARWSWGLQLRSYGFTG